jgi:acetyl esterase/lipase
MFHGGGWAAGNRTELAWFGHLLAEAGLVAISADYRLISDAHVSAEDQLNDVRTAFLTLVTNATGIKVDPQRIGVLGGSAGGHLAAMLATDENTPIRAAAILWGPTDLTVPHSGLTQRGAEIMRDYQAAARSNLAALSPILRLSNPNICRNWLLIHGDKDELVPVTQSRNMHTKLLAVGAQSTYLELAGQGHFPKSVTAQQRAKQALTRFFADL